MRQALRDSIATAVVGPMDGYQKGSILVCVSCAAPLFRLERPISLGTPAGRMVDAFRPVLVSDLAALADRHDVDAGVRAFCKAMKPAARAEYCDTIAAPKKGDPCMCPKCHQVFIFARAAEASDTTDRAYVWEPLMIPPPGYGAPAIRRGVH